MYTVLTVILFGLFDILLVIKSLYLYNMKIYIHRIVLRTATQQQLLRLNDDPKN